jgi:hypothetical protein
MDKQKQIEEIAIKIGVPACKKTGCINCAVNDNCIWRHQAERLYKSGYRKTSDVVEKIFAEIEKLIVRRMIADSALIDDRLITDIAELKKKYDEVRKYEATRR